MPSIPPPSPPRRRRDHLNQDIPPIWKSLEEDPEITEPDSDMFLTTEEFLDVTQNELMGFANEFPEIQNYILEVFPNDPLNLELFLKLQQMYPDDESFQQIIENVHSQLQIRLNQQLPLAEIPQSDSLDAPLQRLTLGNEDDGKENSVHDTPCTDPLSGTVRNSESNDFDDKTAGNMNMVSAHWQESKEEKRMHIDVEEERPNIPQAVTVPNEIPTKREIKVGINVLPQNEERVLETTESSVKLLAAEEQEVWKESTSDDVLSPPSLKGLLHSTTGNEITGSKELLYTMTLDKTGTEICTQHMSSRTIIEDGIPNFTLNPGDQMVQTNITLTNSKNKSLHWFAVVIPENSENTATMNSEDFEKVTAIELNQDQSGTATPKVNLSKYVQTDLTINFHDEQTQTPNNIERMIERYRLIQLANQIHRRNVKRLQRRQTYKVDLKKITTDDKKLQPYLVKQKKIQEKPQQKLIPRKSVKAVQKRRRNKRKKTQDKSFYVYLKDKPFPSK